MGKTMQEPDHQAGECWCGIAHSVPEAARLNGESNYSDMIQRSTTGPDPLVKEPKDGHSS